MEVCMKTEAGYKGNRFDSACSVSNRYGMARVDIEVNGPHYSTRALCGAFVDALFVLRAGRDAALFWNSCCFLRTYYSCLL